MRFRRKTTISMIRIWNYNKSRIHSQRGVRDVIITLDDDDIFKGEIAKACGGMLGSVDAFGDTILFTTDDKLLEAISKHDSAFACLTLASVALVTLEERPTTSGQHSIDKNIISTKPNQTSSTKQIVLAIKTIEIALLSNWGSSEGIGLTGFEIVSGYNQQTVPINARNLTCSLREYNNRLHVLTDDENITTNPENMLLFTNAKTATITVKFEETLYISGLRIWNYNRNLNYTYAGASQMEVYMDQLFRGSWTLRRAPGNVHYDFVQEIQFLDHQDHCDDDRNGQMRDTHIARSVCKDDKNVLYEFPVLPQGFVIQVIIFSTWGDPYYCGLNELELFDGNGRKLILEESNICAYPESVNVLSNVNGDIRTPDKLIDGVTYTTDGMHAWLAPVIPKCLNRIYVVLDKHCDCFNNTTMELFKNTDSGRQRVCCRFPVLFDDLLVYNGLLNKWDSNQNNNYGSVIFTNEKHIMKREGNSIITPDLFMDERLVTGGSLPNADPALRPFTSVSPFNRQYTS